MDIMGTFVGIDGLEVDHMSDNVVLVDNTVPSVHVSALSSNVKRLSAVVSLNQRDLGRIKVFSALEVP